MDIQHNQQLHQIADCLYDTEAVTSSITLLAEQINRDIHDHNLLVICLLNGGLVFTGILIPKLNMALELDYVHVTRYGANNTGAPHLHWRAKPSQAVRGRHVLLCDDVFDEGKTLRELTQYLLNEGALSVRSAVMANKMHNRKPDDFTPDFIGLSLPDRYVFGMGMDYSNYWRNAPGIFALKENSDE